MLLLALLPVACREVPTVDLTTPPATPLQEQMIGANRIISQSEAGQIDAYLDRRGWSKEKLPNGVWVAEYENSEVPLGKAIGYEDTVVIRYHVESLAGETLYDNCRDTVVVGRLKPNRGVDAALRTLHHGATARVIVPSEQGFGVVGDGDRIGSRMILCYTLFIE